MTLQDRLRCRVNVWISKWDSRLCGKPAKWSVEGSGTLRPEPMCGVHARYYRNNAERGYKCAAIAAKDSK